MWPLTSKIDRATWHFLKFDMHPYRVTLDGPLNTPASTGAASVPPPKETPAPNQHLPVGERVEAKLKLSPNEQIKLTKAGITYAGKTAYLSHFYRSNFIYRKMPYSSVEQGLHHLHAIHENDRVIAAAIMSIHEARDIKSLAKDLPHSDEWNLMEPDVLMDLNRAKFDQNPDLRNRLIDTAPHKLVEATVDSKWGGACPFASEIYEQGQVPGQNIAGEQLTTLRDGLISDINDIRMT